MVTLPSVGCRPLPKYEAPPVYAMQAVPDSLLDGEPSVAQLIAPSPQQTSEGVAGMGGSQGSGDGRAVVSQGATGRFEGLEGFQGIGLSPTDMGDMTSVYLEYDQLNKKALDLQVKLDQEGKAVEAGRKAYERARAIHYTAPADQGLQVGGGVRGGGLVTLVHCGRQDGQGPLPVPGQESSTQGACRLLPLESPNAITTHLLLFWSWWHEQGEPWFCFLLFAPTLGFLY